MRVWDCHVHCYGGERAADVLAGMDAAGITRATLMSAFPADFRETCPPCEYTALRREIDHVAGLQDEAPDRICGVFWADPCTEGILDLVEYALADRGLRAVKMIPNHWSPGDEFLFPLYEKMQDLGRPIQFHAGILYAFGDSSRFCRPVLFEALLNFPRLRFALAHIGWPWTDECLAVFGHFNSLAYHRQRESGMWIDTCRGTPDAWREDALRKAIGFTGERRLMFGTDVRPSTIESAAPIHIGKDVDLLSKLGASEQQVEDFFWNAAEAFYGAGA